MNAPRHPNLGLGWPLLLLLASAAGVHAATLVPSNATWAYYIGTNEPTPADRSLWRAVDFDDSGWAAGLAPLGYANPPNDPGGFEARLATLLRAGSSTPTYTSVYLRKRFDLADASALSEVSVTASYDDGVVVWINGVEVGRNRAPSGDLPFNAASPSQAEVITTTFPAPVSLLRTGTNVVAVHLLNGSSLSLDLFFEASVQTAVDDQPPVLVNRLPRPDSVLLALNQVEVFFSEPVTNVDPGDLLINGVGATNVLNVTGAQFLFQFPSPSTGTVQVAFAANHGITDVTALHNPFAGASWSYLLHPDTPLNNVFISEFMAENEQGLHDEDGDDSDWIELFNGNQVSVNLGGWYLTDTSLNLTKWRIPEIGVAESDYLIIYASGKNRTNSTSPLHANFRLSKDAGSYLALVDATGTNVVSAFASYPAQTADVSYGRDRNERDIVGYYTESTPKAANALRGTGFAPGVWFSKSGSTFVTPFDLSLAALGSNAVIRYYLVTNAATAAATNVPNLNSPLYTGPIRITRPTIVRARAFSTQVQVFPGEVRSETFLALNPNVLNFSSDLPLVLIHNFGAGSYPTTQAEFLSAFAVFDNTRDRASLTNTPVLMTRAGVNLRGFSTLTYVKSSFAVEFKGEFNDEQEHSLLGMPPESDWVLYAPNNIEPVLFHNPLYYRMSREVGRYASRTRFAEVFVNTGSGAVGLDHYNGVYVVEEKPKRAPGRVDLARLDVEDTRAPAITGGYLLSIDWVDAGEPTYAVPGVGAVPSQTIIYQYPRGPTLRLPQRDPQEQYINQYFRSFVTNLASPGFNSPTGYVQYIDVDSWVDHFIIAVTAFNVDGLRLSTYMFKDRGKRLEMGPVWDCDRCLGSTDGRDANPRSWAGGGTDFFNWPWWGRLFADTNFFQRYIDRYQEIRQVAFSETNLFTIIDGFAAELQEAYPREFAKWHVQPRGTNGSGAGTFATEVQWKKNYLRARLNFMDTNFLSPVTFSRPGGLIAAGTSLTLTPPNRVGGMTSATTNSVVYYTLNGDDPRAPGGRVAPGTLSNLGPLTIIITNNVRLVARAFNRAQRNLTGSLNPPVTSSWSGPTAETFYVATPSLRITEIMYHPPPSSSSTDDAELFEYLEVQNIAHTELNVNGFRLRGGVDFSFPNERLAAGEPAVIVRDIASFRARYGAAARILGSYTNQLANDADHLVLEGSVREPILDFTYHDDWYPVTDGPGFSLQIVDALAAPESWGLPQSWRPAGVEQGTPGSVDTGAPAIPAVLVNEVMTHTIPSARDAIELFNPTSSPVDLGHWWLTDDFARPRKYRIASGTVMAAGGFLVFTETEFNQGSNPFALSSQGDEVFLFSGDASGRLTGYAHGYSFGAQAEGVTFGRHVISTGQEHFVRQRTATLNEPNAGPGVGPIVIAEIQYHPLDHQFSRQRVNNTEDEYIELLNLTDQVVPLYESANPSSTWRLRDAVDFQFPPNTVLEPGERVLVVSFSPTNGPELAAFHAHYTVPAGTRFFGPWAGHLDNASEAIELEKPQSLPGASTAYVGVDRVRYGQTSPWPFGPDGIGPALHRRAADVYGDDPANWVAAQPGPGRAYTRVNLPYLIESPVGQTNQLAERVVLRVVADGSAPLSYQWRRNGTPIAGATASELVIPSVAAAQAGTYDVVVSNPSGVVLSLPAELRVQVPIQFTVQPQSQSVAAGITVTFSVGIISSEPPVDYQWYFNGARIEGATNASYTIPDVQLSHQGSYYAAVQDRIQSTNSAVATLAVVVGPVFLVQPVSYLETPMGGTATLSVTISNTVTLPLGFGWRRAGISIPGAFYVLNDYTSILTLTNVTNLSPLTYSVRVTNSANRSGVFSSNSVNVAVADRDHDGIADAVELQWGLNPDVATDAGADLDGDTMTNLEEYIAGTDAKDARSFLKVDRFSLPGQTLIEFSAVSNRTYTVQYTDDLGHGNWSKLETFSAHETNHLSRARDLNPGPTRYYRLITPGR